MIIKILILAIIMLGLPYDESACVAGNVESFFEDTSYTLVESEDSIVCPTDSGYIEYQYTDQGISVHTVQYIIGLPFPESVQESTYIISQ